jgi:transcriptional regulator with XRE-family HTH domain
VFFEADAAAPTGRFLATEEPAMSEREAFGPNLRRLRLQRGVSLQQLAASTNVKETVWAALERNDFSSWPKGIFARAYVREYAKAIGVDPESTVNEFCRWFPNGDRRALPTIKGQAQIVGHNELQWHDPVPPTVVEDRRADACAASDRLAKRASNPIAALLRRVWSRA